MVAQSDIHFFVVGGMFMSLLNYECYEYIIISTSETGLTTGTIVA